MHNAPLIALEPDQKPKRPKFQNWNEFISQYPDVVPIPIEGYTEYKR